MPGSSAFSVPPAGWAYNPAATDPVFTNGAYHRQVPTNASSVQANITPIQVTGNADCTALEANTPPTLRTAYDLYGLSIPWSVQIDQIPGDPTYTGLIVVELALLVNGEQRWVGTQSVPNSLTAGASANGSGIITADLINSVRLNPRERLSLRLGVALTSPITDTAPWPKIYAGVGAQISTNGDPPTWTSVQGQIYYNILDLPGNRVL